MPVSVGYVSVGSRCLASCVPGVSSAEFKQPKSTLLLLITCCCVSIYSGIYGMNVCKCIFTKQLINVDYTIPNTNIIRFDDEQQNRFE